MREASLIGVAPFSFFGRWRERRIQARYPIADEVWQEALAGCAPARRLEEARRARLRKLATLFLQRKSIQPVRGLELAAADRALLAAHACLPVLNLGLAWYADWSSIVVYPDVFVPHREEMDEAGVVHHARDVLSGEAWLQGPVVLSWPDVLEAGTPPGHNVVIHEMAHKLDMRNGDANGYPPLARGMSTPAWTEAFTAAWDRLHERHESGLALPIDEYALEDPGEFFAVASEVFFEQPALLQTQLPALFEQLGLFYGAP
ncbi:MAG: zinc-dependent peptidase [Gammaproteobacteria bacterium]|nr:zinc-dependent peptidase [Gammaproteobacteria bacterium]